MPKPVSPAARNDRARKERHTNVLMITLAILCGVLILGVIGYNTLGRSLRSVSKVKALKVGDETYTAAQFNYYYFGAYNELLQNSQGYAGMMGLDTTKSLADQTCTISDEEMSWQDYFTQQATDSLSKMSVAYSEAVKAGYTLTDQLSGTVDDMVEYNEVQGESEGYSDLSSYLTATYGAGFTEDALRELLKQTCIGNAYIEDLKAGYTFTDQQLHDYYSAHIYEYSTYSYLYAYVGTNVSSQDECCNQLAAVTSQSDFKNLTQQLTGAACYTMSDVKGSELGDSTTADIQWISDASRKEGDTYIGQTGDSKYVLYFLSSSDNGFAAGTDDEWKTLAKSGLIDEQFSDWQGQMVQQYGVTTYSGIKYARSLT